MSTVLAYHAIGECVEDRAGLFVSRAAFEAQMAFLARTAEVVDLTTLVAGHERRGRRPVVAITFDDGYRSVLEHAAPVLARHGFPATIFVPTAFLGRANEWDEPSDCPLGILTADELLEAERAGLRMESHGAAHLDLGRATEEEVERDLRESIEVLESAIGRRPQLLAYPYGSSSPTAQRVAERAGFEAAFTIEQLHGGRFAWARAGVSPPDGRALFALKASGAYLPLRRSRLGDAAYRRVKPLFRRRWA